jgi:hypothetical protein
LRKSFFAIFQKSLCAEGFDQNRHFLGNFNVLGADLLTLSASEALGGMGAFGLFVGIGALAREQ